MAVGNVGEFLDSGADASCTWLSRDGGLTWEVSVCFGFLSRAHICTIDVHLSEGFQLSRAMWVELYARKM